MERERLKKGQSDNRLAAAEGRELGKHSAGVGCSHCPRAEAEVQGRSKSGRLRSPDSAGIQAPGGRAGLAESREVLCLQNVLESHSR